MCVADFTFKSIFSIHETNGVIVFAKRVYFYVYLVFMYTVKKAVMKNEKNTSVCAKTTSSS